MVMHKRAPKINHFKELPNNIIKKILTLTTTGPLKDIKNVRAMLVFGIRILNQLLILAQSKKKIDDLAFFSPFSFSIIRHLGEPWNSHRFLTNLNFVPYM